MSEERKKVLGMLAGGQVELADAERLLSKLAGSAEGEPRVKPGDAAGFTRLKYLRVVVDGKDGKGSISACRLASCAPSPSSPRWSRLWRVRVSRPVASICRTCRACRATS